VCFNFLLPVWPEQPEAHPLLELLLELEESLLLIQPVEAWQRAAVLAKRQG
jgi:hypothetical protein